MTLSQREREKTLFGKSVPCTKMNNPFCGTEDLAVVFQKFMAEKRFDSSNPQNFSISEHNDTRDHVLWKGIEILWSI